MGIRWRVGRADRDRRPGRPLRTRSPNSRTTPDGRTGHLCDVRSAGRWYASSRRRNARSRTRPALTRKPRRHGSTSCYIDTMSDTPEEEQDPLPVSAERRAQEGQPPGRPASRAKATQRPAPAADRVRGCASTRASTLTSGAGLYGRYHQPGPAGRSAGTGARAGSRWNASSRPGSSRPPRNRAASAILSPIRTVAERPAASEVLTQARSRADGPPRGERR